MNTSDIKLPSPGKRRGRYSNEFKQKLIAACNEPGVSTAAIAMANGINANLLRRWISESRDTHLPQARVSQTDGGSAQSPAFVRIDAKAEVDSIAASPIELQLQRGGLRITVSGSSAECAMFLRTLWA
jgi:transposase-like protein